VLETPHGHRINITEGRFFIPDNAPSRAALLEMRFAAMSSRQSATRAPYAALR